jgi:cation transport ATPase
MNPLAIPMLLFVVLGIVLAVGYEVFEKKTAFAKEHGTITFFAGLAIIAAAAYAAVRCTHEMSAWLLVLVGFFIVSKIKESRDKRRAFKDLSADLKAKVQSALAARTGSEAVEIDVTKASDGLLWTLINTNKKKGLTVETVKNQSTGAVKLRLSGTAASVS